MSKEIIGHCPICQEQLIASRLTCRHCGLELSNDFTLSKFNYLKEDDLNFIEMYLKCQGSLKELQKQLKISYPAAKRQFDNVLKSLGFNKEDENLPANIEVILSELPIYEDESNTVKSIKKRLNAHNGLATLALPRGGSFQIYYDGFGNGVIATNVPASRVLTWKAFDSAVEVMEKNHGKAKKGQAMKAKLGEPDLTLDTIEGYVAYKAYGIKMGESTLRTISALSSILEWSGICNNGYGYLELRK